MSHLFTSSPLWRLMSLLGIFGLISLLMVWEIWLAPSIDSTEGLLALPRSLVLLFMVVPLLFPLRGILHGRPYTHAWTSFLALFYFMHGVGEAWAGVDTAYLGLLEVLFSVMLFIGAILYTRFRSRELKAEQVKG
ncbi:MAG: DUF2069 domain-containing protein [Gammaproteobacteria bacterium]|nr:DUF2069 domain-containing protein [Gammaproteobacteria bacterium]